MREHPNLHGDLSAGSGHNALARDLDYAARFLEEFQDRLYFGTDICAPDTPLRSWISAEHARRGPDIRAVFGKIARENAVRLLGL